MIGIMSPVQSTLDSFAFSFLSDKKSTGAKVVLLEKESQAQSRAQPIMDSPDNQLPPTGDVVPSSRVMDHDGSVEIFRSKELTLNQISVNEEKEQRVFKAIVTSEDVDSQREIVDIEELSPYIPQMLERGLPITVAHKDVIVGKILDLEIMTLGDVAKAYPLMASSLGITAENKETKVLIATGQIFNDYPEVDDVVWDHIQKGRLNAMSFSGFGIVDRAGKRCDNDGVCGVQLKKTRFWSITLTDRPSNRRALILEKEKESASSDSNMSVENKAYDSKCVEAKIPIILEENPGMKHDQAIAIAISMCSKEKSGESVEALEKEDIVKSGESVVAEVKEKQLSDSSQGNNDDSNVPESTGAKLDRILELLQALVSGSASKKEGEDAEMKTKTEEKEAMCDCEKKEKEKVASAPVELKKQGDEATESAKPVESIDSGVVKDKPESARNEASESEETITLLKSELEELVSLKVKEGVKSTLEELGLSSLVKKAQTPESKIGGNPAIDEPVVKTETIKELAKTYRDRLPSPEEIRAALLSGS